MLKEKIDIMPELQFQDQEPKPTPVPVPQEPVPVPEAAPDNGKLLQKLDEA